jgi:hypothetical protein
MKILLDESLPRKLKNDFGNEHEVWTVRDRGWLGQKNGALLKLMIAEVLNCLSQWTAICHTNKTWNGCH